MKHRYFFFSKQTYLILSLFFLMGQITIGQETSPEVTNDAECYCNDNCFVSEVVDQSIVDDCMTRTIKVHANNCKYALSHFIIQVPCGEITEASNSENWKMVLNERDPKSRFWGLKVDDIDDFGDDGRRDSFTVSYTVCVSDTSCLNELQNDSLLLAYKAGACLYIDTIALPVVEPPVIEIPLRAEIESTNILCNGSINGTVSVDILEGVEPYSFLWNTGDTIQNLTGLAAGVYSVVITDSIGQFIELSAEVSQPKRIAISGEVASTSCITDNGAIEANVTGGVMPYEYVWSDGDTTLSRTNLAMGSYYLQVTDSNGCTSSKSFNVRQISSLNVSITGTALECHQEGKGQISTTVSGGIEPYSYEWTTGETTANLDNLNSGRYQVTITDAEGCVTTRGGYVTIEKLSAAVVAQSPSCGGEDDGTAKLLISNGTAPYDINWSNGDTSTIAENLSAGYYTVDISDVNECNYSRTVIITEPAPLVINSQVIGSSCSSEGSDIVVILQGTGGTAPYEFSENGILIGDTVVYQNEGIHTITMSDASGCSVSDDVDVSDSESGISASVAVVQANCNGISGSAIITANGGLEPYSAVWSDGYVGMTRDNIPAGDYIIEVMDDLGCNNSVTVLIEETSLPSVELNSLELPICNSDDNEINATLTNVVDVEWSILSDSGDWYIQNANGATMIYHSGSGNAKIAFVGTSLSGCYATDTISVSCTSDDNNGGGDTGDGDCDFLSSFSVKSIQETDRDGDCVSFKMMVVTDGQSEHELSHMVLGVNEGWIDNVTNSENWKVEKNSTDPKSGVYGFKIDDISGFGQDGYEVFKVYFTICYNGDIPDNFDFSVVFKAATCTSITNFEFDVENDDHSSVDLHIYPNPFVHDSYFEFSCKKDTKVELHMYDLCGNRVKTLFDGNVRRGEKHKCSFSGRQYQDNMFFYQLVTPEETKRGKILRR